MNKVVASLLRNKHTSGAAGVCVVAEGLAQIAAIWFPQHNAQIDSTLNAVRHLAVVYGLLMAGDAKSDLPPNQTTIETKTP